MDAAPTELRDAVQPAQLNRLRAIAPGREEELLASLRQFETFWELEGGMTQPAVTIATRFLSLSQSIGILDGLDCYLLISAWSWAHAERLL